MDSSLLPEIRVFSPFDPSDLTTFDEIQMDIQDPEDGRSRPDVEMEKSSPVFWQGTFDMRVVNLANFPLNSSAHKLNYRTHSSLMTRAKSSVISSPIKSLNALRAVLQKSISKDLDSVVQSYIDKFFVPAIANMKKNTGDNSCVSDHQLQSICRTMLEEAKKSYFADVMTRGQSCSTPVKVKEMKHSVVKPGEERIVKNKKLKSPSSYSSHPSKGTKGHRIRPINPADGIDRSGPRWDPERLSTDTKFILGSKANKALGFGALRGRLYTKHPDMFRYIGDSEDKVWLSERGLMPPAGGRAYLLVKEDIEELLNSQYQGVPGVSAKAMGSGFVIPQFMVDKMKKLMSDLRSSSFSTTDSNIYSNREVKDD